MIVPSRDEFPRKRVQVGIVLNMAFDSMESEVEAVVTGCCFRRDPCNCPPQVSFHNFSRAAMVIKSVCCSRSQI